MDGADCTSHRGPQGESVEIGDWESSGASSVPRELICTAGAWTREQNLSSVTDLSTSFIRSMFHSFIRT